MDRHDHEQYMNAAQSAMFRFQMIEEALKVYIRHAHRIVQYCLPVEIGFHYKESEFESMPLERLLSVFAKFTHNQVLLKELHQLREMRNYVAHRAFFYATFSATSPHLSFADEFAKLKSALSMADEVSDKLLDEVECMAKLDQKMKLERGKS
jgi:hypothetical protein